MLKKPNFSKKIIKILSEKPAVSMPDIKHSLDIHANHYSLARSLKGLKKSGIVESYSSGQNDYLRLTKSGKKKANALKIENDTALVSSWDGYWRIIILDLPEDRKALREAIRYLLKKARFIALKNSVWISPHPYEHLFMSIKKDLDLSTEMMIIKTNYLDPETEKTFTRAGRKT